MFYRKIAPSLLLQPYIECFYVWECPQINQPLLVESPPTGFASMVFNYGDAYQVRNKKYEGKVVPQAFITGQSTKSYYLQLQGKIGMVGIVFKPSGISSLFGFPMYELVDERTDLTSVLGKELKFISEQILEASSSAARISLLESFLLSQLCRQNVIYDRVDYAANMIVNKYGIIHVNELVEDVFLCRRQFERKFLYKVGVSPKYYARIRRVSFLCATLATNKWKVNDWHYLIHQLGYYDQAHFIKDFTDFTGRSPCTYVKHNVELAHYFK